MGAPDRGAAGTALLLAVLWLTAACSSPRQLAVSESESLEDASANQGVVRVLEDPSAALTLADVSGPALAASFVPLDTPTLRRGTTSSAFWLRFEIGARATPLLLEVDNPTLTSVCVYRLDDRGRLVVTRTGQLLPVSTRDVAHPSFVFDIAPAEGTTVYVRAASRQSIRVPLRLWRPVAFFAADRKTATFSGVFYGALALTACYQLLLALGAPDRSHLTFAVTLIAACVTLLGLDGVGTFYLWPGLTPWAGTITTAASVVTVVSLLVFTSQFLALKERAPAAHRVLAIFGVAVIVGGLLVPYTVPYLTVSASALLASLLIGAHSWAGGYAPARRFVLAWLLITGGTIAGQLVQMGFHLPGNLRADYLYRLAALPAVALVSASLGERLWLLRRAAARAESARQQQERILVEVARGVVGTTGEQVFSSLVRHAAQVLEADVTLVGELIGGDRMRVVALWIDGAEGERADYRLAGTPCQKVMTGGACTYVDDVQQHFPEDAGLRAMAVRGYVGRPLLDSTGRTIGLLACLYRRRVTDAASVEHTLRIFASRAASELERRRAERALAERETLLGALLENSPAIVYVKDPEGRYLLVNRQYEERVGLPRDRILGRTDAELLPPDLAAAIRANDLLAMRHESPQQFEEAGRGQYFLSTKAALRDAAGEPWATIGVSTEITEFLRLQTQLRASQRMEAFGQLAGGVAHDFNNLLTAILGYIDLCESQATPDSPLAHDLAEARDASLRAARITGQLLAFARRQPSTPQAVDLNQVVRHLERLLRQAAGTHVTLQLAVSDQPVGVWLDPTHFEQVLLNLVLNARDSMNGGGVVRVETLVTDVPANLIPAGARTGGGRYAALRVCDTGGGIAAEHLPRIFEPFFTTKPAERGTGLGLSMCHGIVRQAGGFITVESRLGEGTTFTVFLPETHAGHTVSTRVPAPPAAGGSERILLVDDEAAVRRFATRALESRGYRVIEAEDGPSALALALRHPEPIDLLLTDVAMPGLNGRELAAALRTTHPGIAVLYMSGYAELALAEDGRAADGAGFLAKPFTVEQLAARVREQIDGTPTGGETANAV